MKPNNKCCRRSFLKKGLAVSAGVTLIGTGMKLFAQQEDEWRWVAYCCQRCDTCAAHLDDSCWTCKSAQGLLGTCDTKRCAIDVKDVPTCAHCDDLDDCTIISSDGKTRAQNLRETLPTSVHEKNQDNEFDLKVIPNPSSDHVKILNPQCINTNYELINLQGRIVKKGIFGSTEYLLNISDLHSGNYILRLENNNAVLLTHKIVKY